MTEAVSSEPIEKSWRKDAARIVEELFRSTSAESWDLLLELRQNLLKGRDWNRTLDVFLACRERLELTHYLPFYRLRNLLANSLTLEASGNPMHDMPLRKILQRKHKSLADIRRRMTRDLFERGFDVSIERPMDLLIVERV